MTIRIEAGYKVATPLFCAGTDPRNQAEIRLPSFKGALRFWWRALAWSSYGGDLGHVRQREAELFGSAETGQSKVSMRLEPHDKPRMMKSDEILKSGDQVVGQGARYLGYGVMEAFGSKNTGKQAGQITRGCLESPLEFTMQMRLRECEEQLPSLKNALICLGALGGMGAKSRKGYGSLVLQRLEVNGEGCWIPPKSPEELESALEPVLANRIDTDYPPYTAFSARSKHLLVTGSDSDSMMRLLNHLGCELVRYRSWGCNGKILGQIPSEKNFKQDHDLMEKPRRKKHPERIAFGLPHNYGGGTKQQVEPAGKDLDRRASPLFIHIHECGTTPVGVVSFLPALFLPNKSKIRVGMDDVPQHPEDKLYEPIQRFLDRLLANPKEPIQAREVWL